MLVRVPEGQGARVLEAAARHGAVNTSRWTAAGAGDERYEMVLVHVANAALGPLADALEEVPELHLSLLPAAALALRPPAAEVAEQTRDVTPQSPLEIYLGGLQSVGSWQGFLGYAAIAGAVVWLGLATNNVALLIGAMLIAPFASPAMNAAVATARGDGWLMAHAIARYAAALATTVGASALLTLVFRQRAATEQMVSIATISPAAFLLPLAAGAAGALALGQSQRSSLVSGAGAGLLVAASLAPPAGVIGMAAAMGRWDLTLEAAFLLALQFAGIGVSGTLVFRVLGLGPRGQRYPRGSRAGARAGLAVLVLAFGGLIAWQLASPAPTLKRAGLQEQAREVVRSTLDAHPRLVLLETRAAFPRPRSGAGHPLVVRVYVQRRAGSPPPSTLEPLLGSQITRALRDQLQGVTPLVEVTALSAEP